MSKINDFTTRKAGMPENKNGMRGFFTCEFAFTLAEVLITLAIIGVVAALTIPSRIVSYEKKATATRVKKAFSELNQVIKLSEIENGLYKNWDFTQDSIADSRRFLEKYITPYFSGITECSTGLKDDCGIPVSGLGINYKLNNGTGISLRHSIEKKMYIIISTNLNKKKGFIRGKNVFYFIVTEDGKVLPYGWCSGVTREEILNDGLRDGPNNYACRKEKRDLGEGIYDLNRHGCTLLL